MNLARYYDAMWQQARPRLQINDLELDSLLDDVQDRRLGLTLRLRPSPAVQQAAQAFQAELRHLEPAQYYYPPTDVHVTVLTLISCYNGFSLDQIDPAAYAAPVAALLQPFSTFDIDFRGITASPATVLLQGFPQDGTLEHLRDQLRAGLRQTELPLTMDHRYTIQTAHSTLVRFGAPLQRPQELVCLLERYREQPFGTSAVQEVELVLNDWYHRAAVVQRLAAFQLE